MTLRATTALLLLTASTVQGFAPATTVPSSVSRATSSPSSPVELSMVVADTEDHATYLLSKARECAYSTDGSYSAEDAQMYLHEMLHIQSGCASGKLIGHDLCEDQDTAADIVAHLRLKAMGATPTTEDSEPHSAVPAVATFMSTSSLAMVVAMLHSTIGSTPETFEEWLLTTFF